MQLGFERRKVWTLLYPSSLSRIQATSCMISASNQFLKPKNSFSWLSHKEKNPTQCSAKFITRPLLPIEYLGQKRLEIYNAPPPPSPQLRIGKQHALAFAQLHPRVFFLGGGRGRGMVGLLFHFILSKIVVKIICGMGCERKNLYRQMSIESKRG